MEKNKKVKMSFRKKQRTCCQRFDFFDGLPDDLLISILCKIGSSASSPSDFINVILTCKRMNRFGISRLVLAELGLKALTVKAKNWTEYAHRFLKRCAHAGNIEAHYMLGMIRFYCLKKRPTGMSLMARAALKSHAPSLYSLAVIHFNGSGKSKYGKDLRTGVALCARAAFLGHIDALRELGHCLQDGYGVRRNIAQGRRLLVQANARELASALRTDVPASSEPHRLLTWHCQSHQESVKCPFGDGSGCPILSDFGCNVPCPEAHPANRFMVEWFGSGRRTLGIGLTICSNIYCGRPETRPHEFRRCSVCGSANYCSRGCQALHWKSHHRDECAPRHRQVNGEVNDHGNGQYVEVEIDAEDGRI